MIVCLAVLAVLLCQIDFLRYAYYYQIESYEKLKFYKCFLKKQNWFDLLLYIVILSLFLLELLFDSETTYILFIVLFVCIITIKFIIFSSKNNKNKIKLKYTKRLFRLNFMYLCVVLLTITIMILSQMCILILACLLDVLIFIFSIYLVLPIEMMVCNYYLSKAKIKLKSIKNLKVIAITGSYGKTSTKMILNELLSQKYNVCFTPASYNTPMGICKCILNNLKPYHEILILEFGAKRVGEIDYLCKNFCPEYGIITSIGRQHLDTFKTYENVIKTKMELFEYISDRSKLYINYSNDDIRKYCDKYDSGGETNNVVDFSSDEHCYNINCVGYKNVIANSNGLSFDYICESGVEKFSSKLIGKHNVLNISLCIAVAKSFGLTYSQICVGLSGLKSISHRLELKDYADYLLIDNAYNSNPNSFRCAIDTLCLFSDYRKIVITPGVVEQGNKMYDENYSLGKYMVNKVDLVYVINKTNRDAIVSGLIDCGFDEKYIKTYDKFSDVEFTDFKKGDVILIENDLPDNYI